MTLFGPSRGNLPLVELPESQLLKLSGPTYHDFRNQLMHYCIRSAWLTSANSSHDIRVVLDLAVARAQQRIARLRGETLSARFLDMDMERARRENELRSCFGLFLEDEIEHLIYGQRAGPVLTGILPMEKQSYPPFHYAGLLGGMLTDYRRNLRGDKLAWDTAQFAQAVSQRHACIESMPSTVEIYFELADILFDADVEEEASI